MIHIDLESGDYRENPSTNFPRILRDMEFSSDPGLAFFQQGNSLYSIDVNTWETAEVAIKPGDHANHPINLLPMRNGPDLFVFRNHDSKTIINPETGDFFGTINERFAEVVVAPDRQSALSLYNGVVTRYEFRDATFTQGRLNLLNGNANNWSISFNSEENSFYRIQSSWDLRNWETFENTLPGTGEEIEEFFMSITIFTNVFGRVLEFRELDNGMSEPSPNLNRRNFKN